MYIVSSMSNEYKSIGGGLLQTVTRLGTMIGSGITTAIFDAIQERPLDHGYHSHDYIGPYAATFWFSTATCALSILLVPFLRIQTQGHEASER